MARTPEQNNAIITGSIPRQLLLFFFPIWLGTMFQQLYNTVDTLIVGNFVGTQALAAVGATSSFVQLLVGLFVGLCSGAGVIIAQSFGAGDYDEVNRQMHTALALAIAGGAALTVIGLLISRPVLRLMQTPDEIVGMASEYLQIYFLGMIPQMIYNMGTNILRAVGDSKRPLYFLIVASIVNIVLDIVLVAVIPLGVAGAAIATVASQVVSAVLTVRCIHGSQGMPWHLQLKNIRIERSVLLAICRIGLPGAAQSALYSISNMTIQSAINGFGTVAVAAWSVYGKIDFLFWMTVSSFGIAVTTFAGQNFGARQYDRMKRCTRVGLGMCLGTIIALSALLFIFRYQLLMFFTGDAEVVNIGAQFCLVLAPSYFTFVFIEILSGAIRGAGEALQPMLITCIGVCGLRVVWILLMVPYWHTMQMVAMNYPVSWVITAVIFVIYYLRGKWLDRCIKREHDPQHGTATEA